MLLQATTTVVDTSDETAYASATSTETLPTETTTTTTVTTTTSVSTTVTSGLVPTPPGWLPVNDTLPGGTYSAKRKRELAAKDRVGRSEGRPEPNPWQFPAEVTGYKTLEYFTIGTFFPLSWSPPPF